MLSQSVDLAWEIEKKKMRLCYQMEISTLVSGQMDLWMAKDASEWRTVQYMKECLSKGLGMAQVYYNKQMVQITMENS